MPWFGASSALRSQKPMEDSERLQRVVNEIAPARWQEIEVDHFRAEFYAQAETKEDAAKQIGSKVKHVHDRLADLGAKVENLSDPGPAIPPRRPPKDIVAYEE